MADEVACFEDGTYSVVCTDPKTYVPFGEMVPNGRGLGCSCCGEAKALTWWVNIMVNTPPERPLRDGSYGSWARMGYYCSTCRPIIEPHVMRLYDQSAQTRNRRQDNSDGDE